MLPQKFSAATTCRAPLAGAALLFDRPPHPALRATIAASTPAPRRTLTIEGNNTHSRYRLQARGGIISGRACLDEDQLLGSDDNCLPARKGAPEQRRPSRRRRAARTP